MTVHIIIASEMASQIYQHLNCLIEKEDHLQYASHKEEVYWKDHSMLDIYFEIQSNYIVTRSPSVAYGASSLPEGAFSRIACETVEMFTKLWYNESIECRYHTWIIRNMFAMK